MTEIQEKRKSLTVLLDQEKEIEKVKEYKCNLCRMTFANSNNLQNHVKTVHVSTKPFECESEG